MPRGGVETHGMSRTTTYRSWKAMKTRCQNPNHYAYQDYGGRGITVCDRWQSFEGFYEDMGDKPTTLSLDRVDNEGNYNKENCRWTDNKTQCRNKRNNVYIDTPWGCMSQGEAAERAGITRDVLHQRIKKLKWPKERWFEPTRKHKGTAHA